MNEQPKYVLRPLADLAAAGTRVTPTMVEGDDAFEEHEFNYLYDAEEDRKARVRRAKAARAARLRLYTATLACTRDNIMTQAFHASIAQSSGEVRARLAGRFGPHLAAAADIRVGMHPASPLVVALVPVVVVEMIVGMQSRCEAPESRLFAIDIQQIIHG
jgi:hypothetical protein